MENKRLRGSRCLAISGLGSHAFDSWKDRHSSYMWLRDALPQYLPNARVLIYGYDTKLAGSQSFQNLSDIGSRFRASLRVALGSVSRDRPFLGGLVLKQAMVQMSSGDAADSRNFKATYGILFFGVPNQGMDINSSLAMVRGQPNLHFLSTLSKDSGFLQLFHISSLYLTSRRSDLRARPFQRRTSGTSCAASTPEAQGIEQVDLAVTALTLILVITLTGAESHRSGEHSVSPSNTLHSR